MIIVWIEKYYNAITSNIDKFKFDNIKLISDNLTIKNILRKKPNIIIPLDFKTMMYLNAHTSILSKLNITLFCPSTHNISIFNNKRSFYELMTKLDLLSYMPKEIKDKTVFPIIIKDTNGSGGRGIHIVHNSEEYDNKINTLSSDNYIMQEFITKDNEHCAQFLVINGKIIDVIYYGMTLDSTKNETKDFIRSGSVKNYGGKEINLSIPEFKKIYGDIFMHTNYTGFIDTDFTIIDDSFKIFETNPRMGQSLFTSFENLQRMFSKIFDFYQKK